MSFGYCRITYPNGRQEQVELVKPTVHIGSAPDNTIVLQSDLVADYHAQLLCDAAGCQVVDLGHETVLEKTTLVREVPEPLVDGATLYVGDVVLVYYLPVSVPAVPEVEQATQARRGWFATIIGWFRRMLPPVAVGCGLLVLFFAGDMLARSWLSYTTSSAEGRSSAEAATATATVVQPTTTPSATATEPPVPLRTYVVTTTNSLNLHVRSAPGEDQPILGKLPYGAVVLSDNQPVRVGNYNWIYVKSETLTGWCVIEALEQR